jgi:hypothetical protein
MLNTVSNDKVVIVILYGRRSGASLQVHRATPKTPPLTRDRLVRGWLLALLFFWFPHCSPSDDDMGGLDTVPISLFVARALAQ